MQARIRLQGDETAVKLIQAVLNNVDDKKLKIEWKGEYQDFTKRWSKNYDANNRQPTGRIRVYGVVTV